MFNRLIMAELVKWKEKSNRKPLVIRGARQVGKTTLVNQFSKNFKQYIYLNLELQDDKLPFIQFTDLETLIQTVFFIKKSSLKEKEKTLLFIDEIQEVPLALNILRYFYENEPGIAVIAAGSMLETLFHKNISFPVGRVEYLVLRPASFLEFLDAMEEKDTLNYMKQIPIASFTHQKLLKLFHLYALIGGMPEIIKQYVINKDLLELSSIYDSLITAYLDDVEKYASGNLQIQHLRHTIRACFSQAGKRIKFEGFGNSLYRSRDMSEALRTLEKALLIQLVFPCTDVKLPLLPNHKKSPKLQVLDTGMVNYFVGIQKEIISTNDLNSVYQGTMIEHLVGQELLSNQFNSLSELNFWAREKQSSMAEVDFLFVSNSKLIPLEVKAGVEGKLKSLHIFMDLSPQNVAIRFYSGQINITKAVTPGGKSYDLINLPYYLVSQVEQYLEWFGDTKHEVSTS